MLQALIDANGIVTDINDWDEGVGIPCDANTKVGMQFNGSEFVESLDSLIARYDARLTSHFNQVAKSKKYDSWVTCSLRAGIIDSPFHLEGKVFAKWMDECNAMSYEIMGKVLTGVIQMPTEDEFIGLMPTIIWPS